MEVIQVRVHNSDLAHAKHLDAPARVIFRGAVNPAAIEDEMIHRCTHVRSDESHNRSQILGPRNFQPNEAVVVRAIGERDGAGDPTLVHDYLRQNITWALTSVSGTIGQRRQTRVTGRHSLAFGRKRAIRGARPNHNPVLIIARLCGQGDIPKKLRSGLQFDRVATVGAGQSCLEASPGVDRDCVARCRCITKDDFT